ncbi:MAG TPA: ParB/RepB/Spo0J family partition protein [Candidatus Dormibacteraeota bacterium]|nr:ParB/RepB/Spo0J family partition protein [Candidatus Dormibacteraeota bacterium]
MTRNALGRGLGALIREPEALVGTGAANADNLANAGNSSGVAGATGAQDAGAITELGKAGTEQALAGPDPGEGSGQALTGGGPAAVRAPASAAGAQWPIAAAFASPTPGASAAGHGGKHSGLHHIDIELIRPSPYQPRKHFSEEGLDQLARSITNSGVIQPVVVRQTGSHYQLIAGERRWRAAQRAELRSIPAIVHNVPDDVALEFTLIENLQREDLNPMEEARAYDRLIQEFGLTHDEVAARTGKDRTTIANALRLLGLENGLQQMLEEGKLSPSAGRALLAVMDGGFRRRMAARSARGALTVRQIEKLAARQARRERGAYEHKPPEPLPPDPNIRRALEELQRILGTKVTLVPRLGKKAGQLIIEYYDEAQLMGLWDQLSSRR